MIYIKSVLFIFIVLALKNVLAFQGETMIKNLNLEASEELKQLLNAPSKLKPFCKNIGAVKVSFLLYNRKNKEIPIDVKSENLEEVDDRKTIMLFHGWLSDSNSSATIELKNEYLKLYDCNVIVVDWSEISWQKYTMAFCAVPRISFYVSKFMCNLEGRFNGSLKEMHAIGHSVGAQIMGVVGFYVKNRCQKDIGRMTGLDPAGPLFQDVIATRRLDSNDAMFVDIIHTDEFQFGYKGNIGSIDFHVNCGQLQPGCSLVRDFDGQTSISTVLCSHLRSLEYMKISVNSQNFVAVSCGLCPRYCRANIISEEYVVMGEHCPTIPRATKNFLITTSSSYPYYTDATGFF